MAKGVILFLNGTLGSGKSSIAKALYDVQVDTSKLSPQECATRIIDCMGGRQHLSAFEQLREHSPEDG